MPILKQQINSINKGWFFNHLHLTVQILNDIMFNIWTMENNNDLFNVLRKIQKKPKTSQRELAEEVGFSLGKLNYCLKALQKKGLVKLQNFQKQSNKMTYLQYIITPKGIAERTKLTINFMKRKMSEYDELKKELKKYK